MQREIFLSLGYKDTGFERFAYALDFVRRKYPSMTLGTFATFLAIARHREPEGITATELGERLKLPLPTVFRQCNQLADGQPGKPGMRLVKKIGSDVDRRARSMKISLTGLALLTDVTDILSVELPIPD